jgi:hypothetical protein
MKAGLAVLGLLALTAVGCQRAPTASETAAASAGSQTPSALEPVNPTANEWFVADADFSSCFSSGAPAERIHDIRSEGLTPDVKEGQAPDGTMKVEVGEPLEGALQTTYVTYYRSKAGCEAALAGRNSIPAKYQ